MLIARNTARNTAYWLQVTAVCTVVAEGTYIFIIVALVEFELESYGLVKVMWNQLVNQLTLLLKVVVSFW